jgi:two-component system KDP operon response regulator KdpE
MVASDQQTEMADVTTILVIDDEPTLHGFLRPALRDAGYRVLRAVTVSDGLRLVTEELPSLVLLDLTMPDMDGLEAIPLIQRVSSVPIIVVTARDQILAKITALDSGAEDYVEKPFAVEELLARIRAALRRSARLADPEAAVSARFGALEIDFAKRSSALAGLPMHLTPREWDVLAVLARSPGRVLTRSALLVAVWGKEHVEDVHYLRIQIASLRRKLGAAAGLLHTHPGVGYRLDELP